MNILDEKTLSDLLSRPETRRKAFEAVVNQYSEPLYWKIRRMVLNHEDANDVLQNALLKAWYALDDFQNKAKLSTWLYRIAINESLDFLRKQRTERNIYSDTDDTGIASQLLADEYFDGTETEALLQEAIAHLPEVQRTVFNLKYYENLKYSEISHILHTSEGALKASYHLAVKKITDFFKARD